MKKVYKLCMDADCRKFKKLPEEVLESYFQRLAWIS